MTMLTQKAYDEIDGFLDRIRQLRGQTTTLPQEFSGFLSVIEREMQEYTSDRTVFTKDIFTEDPKFNDILVGKLLNKPDSFAQKDTIKAGYVSISRVNRLYYRTSFAQIKQLYQDAKNVLNTINDCSSCIAGAGNFYQQANTLIKLIMMDTQLKTPGLTLFSAGTALNTPIVMAKVSLGLGLVFLIGKNENLEVVQSKLASIDMLIDHYQSTGSDAIFLSQLTRAKNKALDMYPALNNIEAEQTPSTPQTN